MRIVITPAAEGDITAALVWYQERSVATAQRLLVTIDQTLFLLGEHAVRFRVVERNRGIRRAFVRRFPYCVYYVVDGDAVVVLAFLHDRRNPQTWRGRG